jgi:hypothetical protein
MLTAGQRGEQAGRMSAMHAFGRAAMAAIILLALGACATDAAPNAQTRAPANDAERQVAAISASPNYQAFLLKAVNEEEPLERRATCNQPLRIVDGSRFLVIRPAVLTTQANGTQTIAEGTWVAYLIVDRCGSRAIRRLLVNSAANETKAVGLLPGEFTGDLVLERDTSAIVYTALLAKAGCPSTDRRVVVTDISNLTKPGGTEGWSEQWTAVACGKPVATIVYYRPSPRGGTDIATEPFQLPREETPAPRRQTV